MKRSTIFFLVLALALVAGSANLWARVVHVPDDHETIQGAIDASEEGDTVQIAPGEYHEMDLHFGGVNITVRGDVDNPSSVTIIGAEVGSTILIASGEGEETVLEGVTLSRSSDSFIGFNGGGISIHQSDPTIRYCNIENNIYTGEGASTGAGIFTYDFNGIISHCKIRNNHGSEEGGNIGGGIFFESSNPTVESCEISNNAAPGNGSGGGVWLYKSNVQFINCTIVENISDTGGGIFIAGDGEVILLNCIVWGNTNQQLNADSNMGYVGVINSDIEDGWEGEGNIDEDPQFVNANEGNYYLTEDSPCVDAGTSLYVWEEDTLVNIPEDMFNGFAPDMGAYESEYENDVEEVRHYLKTFRLYTAYPNPFNSTTKLSYGLPVPSDVSVMVYDVSGQLVSTLISEHQIAGQHNIVWNAQSVPTGVYLVRMEADAFSAVRKVVLVK